MKAWVLKEAGKLIFEEIEEPKIKANEVLVRVKNCGICGSDIPRAYRDGAHNMPLIIGHEFAGEVVCAGDDVSPHKEDSLSESFIQNLQSNDAQQMREKPEKSKETKPSAYCNWEGKRVGIFPLIPCMKCGPCLAGRYEMCRSYSYLGSRRDGGFAEYVAVPEWNLIELPDEVSFEQAAMLEPMAVAAHAIRRLDLSGTGRVAIYGQGTIGLFVLMLLIAEGIKDICVFGNHDIQKDRAVKLGLKEEAFCDIRHWDVASFALDWTDGRGFDASFEAVGSIRTYSQAVELSAPGGQVCLMGNPSSDMVLERNIYWKILRNQLKIFGTWNSSFKGVEDDWKYVLKLLKDERIKPETVISHRYPLEELEKGFLIMRDKTEDYIKIMADI